MLAKRSTQRSFFHGGMGFSSTSHYGEWKASSQFICADDNLNADPQGFCCSADTLLRTKGLLLMPGYYEIAFCETPRAVSSKTRLTRCSACKRCNTSKPSQIATSRAR